MHRVNCIKHSTIIAGILVCFGFSGTVSHQVDPDEFQRFVRTNEAQFKREIVFGNIHYAVTYLPEELQIISDVQNKLISPETGNDQLKKRSNNLTFLFEIRIPVNGNKEFLKYPVDSTTYEERLNYYAFDFKNDFFVTNGKGNRLPVSNFLFEREFGLSGKGTFVIQLKSPMKSTQITLRFFDQILSKELIEIRLTIPQLPKLKNCKKWKIQE